MPKAVDHMALVVRDPARSARLLAQVFGDARVESGQGDHGTLAWLGGVCLALACGDSALYFDDYDNHVLELEVTEGG